MVPSSSLELAGVVLVLGSGPVLSEVPSVVVSPVEELVGHPAVGQSFGIVVDGGPVVADVVPASVSASPPSSPHASAATITHTHPMRRTGRASRRTHFLSTPLLAASTCCTFAWVSAELDAMIATARAAWPDIDADEATFVGRIDTVLAAGASAAALHASDLWLAVACECGNETALAAFERTCIEPIERVLAHMRLPAEAVDEIQQVVRTRLLVPTGDAPAKIAEYRGRGPLRSWVGVIATREALGQARRVRPTPGDEALMGIESPHTGPELGYLTEHAREAFREAFTAALAELTPRARNALRHHYVHGLTIDQIAATYGVHRSNAARRIAKARDTLLSAMRRRVLIALNVDRGEFESMMRMVESKLDVSLQRLLGPE